MSLTFRLLTFFLVGLAVVLASFSATLVVLARSYLHRQLDDRLEAAMNTLAAIAEVENGAIEWDREDKLVGFGGGVSGSEVLWTVHGGDGQLLDESAGIDDSDPLRRDIAPGGAVSGYLPDGMLGPGRRYLRRTLSLDEFSGLFPTTKPPAKPLQSRIHLTVAASETPMHALLEQLALVLLITAVAIWSIALLAGRWFCRRALRPVAEMARQAQSMNADERSERLRFRQSGDELEALGRAFNGLLDRLHEALHRQRRFTGEASHQLRTPLTALLGQVEVALRRPRTEEEYEKALGHVRTQGEHLRQIVEMLLYLARADAEARLEELAPIDLSAWLPGHMRTWRPHARVRDLRLALPRAKQCFAQVQAPLLGQLLDNLIDNAFQYSQPGSPVIVRLETQKERTLLVVEDRGMGIAEADLPHLFEPFFRSESARACCQRGVGLGLAIAQRIAQLFGGDLSASGTVGVGSQFTLSLPPVAAPAQGAS